MPNNTLKVSAKLKTLGRFLKKKKHLGGGKGGKHVNNKKTKISWKCKKKVGSAFSTFANKVSQSTG